MFRSLHMKLVLIMLLLITSLMAVVGAFLMTSVTNFYIDGRTKQHFHLQTDRFRIHSRIAPTVEVRFF